MREIWLGLRRVNGDKPARPHYGADCSTFLFAPFFNCIMSLFRTLQNSPATITIFHNPKLRTLATLYHHLEQAYHHYGESKDLFLVDLMTNKMPTYDQFLTIAQACLKDDTSKTVLRNCFPFMYDLKSIHHEEPRGVTKKLRVGPDWEKMEERLVGIKMFSEKEYAMIYDAYNKAVEEKDIPEEDIFRSPLVVDWDQSLIAGDETTLAAILDKYKK